MSVPGLVFAAERGLSIPDYVMIGVYLLATFGILFWSARQQDDTEEFFLAGRRMPWLAVGLSMMATLLSTISYLSLPGEMIKHGIGVFATYLAYPLAMMVVIPLFIPFFMRMRLTSAYEYLELRFDGRARLLGSLLFFSLRLGWISMVMYAGSLAIGEMAGWPLHVVIMVLGIAATAYTFLGGLRAVIWTDVLQAIMLFGGAAVIVIYVWAESGRGPGEWWTQAQSMGHVSTPLISLDPRVRMTFATFLFNGFFWQVCTHCSDQVVLQRYSATPSVAAARNSYVINMTSSLAIGLLLGLAGLALLDFYTHNPGLLPAGVSATESGDALMPWFYSRQLPLGFGGLILANFLCDAMQTLVSGVNSMTAVATRDIFDRLRARWTGISSPIPETNANISPANSVWTARVLSCGIGLICTCAALGIATLAGPQGPLEKAQAKAAKAAAKAAAAQGAGAQKASAETPAPGTAAASIAEEKSLGKNIYDLMPRAFNMFLGPLASLFLCGMFIPRSTGRSVLPAILLTCGFSIGWNYVREIGALATWLGLWSESPINFDLSPTWAIGVPCLLGMLLTTVFSLMLDKGGDHRGRQYTWWAVMRRPADQPLSTSP